MNNSIYSSPTFTLLKRPNFLEGLGSIVDICGGSGDYNYSRTAQEADSNALISDSKAVAMDFQQAMEVIVEKAKNIESKEEH